MNSKKVLVTGGSGFLGAALVRALLVNGYSVRVLDNNSRGSLDNLADIASEVDFVKADIRDFDAVRQSMEGISTVYHLAYVNGTEYFYTKPGMILDIALRGQLNVIDAAVDTGVECLVYASSSETYQTPPVIPTPEEVPLVVPDIHNPRYSYGGGKIAGELLLLHYAPASMKRIIFRPHNVYGPAMGFEHVIPQIAQKIIRASDHLTNRKTSITIQGDGSQTRAFCFAEDAARAIMLTAEKGNDREIFNIGTDVETAIGELVMMMGNVLETDLTLQAGTEPEGATNRRCPDISKLRNLGYEPRVDLMSGLEKTLPWYVEHT